jgi:hypothetical protein
MMRADGIEIVLCSCSKRTIVRPVDRAAEMALANYILNDLMSADIVVKLNRDSMAVYNTFTEHHFATLTADTREYPKSQI